MVFNYVVGFCSIIALYITYRSTKREKTRKLHCHSSLDLDDGARAIIKIVNVGVPNITIENIALSLVIWEDKPWFPLKGLSIISQIVNKIWNYQHDQVYISKSKILNPMITKYPETLTDSQYITVSIDLIETIDIFKRKCDFVELPL